ncbi:LEPR protein, partial [Atractosteus spatula]|nr:LEPR protein [Atractosteus spatula]
MRWGSHKCTFQPLYLSFCYVMWLEIHHELGPVKSHPTYVTPMDVVKPHPPLNLEAEITVPEGHLSISWQRTELPVYDLQFEIRYAVDGQNKQWKLLRTVYNETVVTQVADPCVVYMVQIRCKRFNGPGHWSTWSSPVYTVVHDIQGNGDSPPSPSMCGTHLDDAITAIVRQNPHRTSAISGLNSRFLSSQRKGLSCGALEEDVHVSRVEECPVMRWGSHKCTFQPLYLSFCYVMWLEIHHELGPVKSHPTYVTPMDVVKPHPPLNLEAEITVPEGHLSISWQRTELPVYDLQFEIRYAVDGQNKQWKLLRTVYNETVVTQVADPCVVYMVQIRCKRFNGPGHWSTWSSPVYTVVHDIQAPEQGPDFWRMIREDPAMKQTNVTLLIKPLRKEDLFCSVDGFIVQHQTSSDVLWYEYLNTTTTYTFPWIEDVHSVSVLAFNSVGSSVMNYNLTFTRHTRKVQTVQSFSCAMVNSSSVALSWNLLPNRSLPESFIIEWKLQNREKQLQNTDEAVKWVRAPPKIHTFYLYDTFFLSEEYQFILYPIFLEGEGEPISKDKRKPKGEQAAYILLLLIAFLSVVLFVTLAVSQHQVCTQIISNHVLDFLSDIKLFLFLIHTNLFVFLNIILFKFLRMKKLVWKDVPNPNNCSWAQGVDFKRVMNLKKYILSAVCQAKQKLPTDLYRLRLDNKDPPDCGLSESYTSPTCTLGVDLRRGRRRHSGNLQLPPLSWRQAERARTPDEEIITRPTTLPFIVPPRIDITPVDPEW